MRILLDEHQRCADWLYSRINVAFSPLDSYVIGVERDGVIEAAVGYKDFTGRSVCMHVAIDNPCAIHRRFVWLCFDYPFNQMGVEKVLGVVDSSNAEALNLDLKLGFRPVATVEGVYENGDMLILEMRKSQCRWLKYGAKYGKEIQSPAAA